MSKADPRPLPYVVVDRPEPAMAFSTALALTLTNGKALAVAFGNRAETVIRNRIEARGRPLAKRMGARLRIDLAPDLSRLFVWLEPVEREEERP